MHRRWLVGQLTQALPLLIMMVLALGSWWLAQSAPEPAPEASAATPRTEPDGLMRNFSIKTFESDGRLSNEVWGEKATRFPLTGLLEIDGVKFRAQKSGVQTTGQAQRAYANADGSELQLVGDAVVVREMMAQADGQKMPRLEFRGEFLHAFVHSEAIKSHLPVTVTRGSQQLSGDALAYSRLDGQLALDGRVRVRFEGKPRS